jgi:hypothetical protein
LKTEADVQEFEKLEQQLQSMLAEMAELSKKKANDGINKFKLKLINVLLESANKILEAYKPFKDFDKFEESELPTNSDVVVVLSQYVAAVFLFRSDNTDRSPLKHEWVWLLKGAWSEIVTKSPNEFKYEGN